MWHFSALQKPNCINGAMDHQQMPSLAAVFGLVLFLGFGSLSLTTFAPDRISILKMPWYRQFFRLFGLIFMLGALPWIWPLVRGIH
jgi:hypothetical protein